MSKTPFVHLCSKPLCFTGYNITSKSVEIIWHVLGRIFKDRSREKDGTHFDSEVRVCIMILQYEKKQKQHIFKILYHLHLPTLNFHSPNVNVMWKHFLTLPFFPCMLIYTNVSISFPFMLNCWSLLVFFWVAEVLAWNTQISPSWIKNMWREKREGG